MPRKAKEENGGEDKNRVALNVTRQYPVDSLAGRRVKALRNYYRAGELKTLVENAIWLVLGPLASALEGTDQAEVTRQIQANMIAIQLIQHQTLEMVGASLEVQAPELSPVVPQVQSQASATVEDFAPLPDFDAGDEVGGGAGDLGPLADLLGD